MKTPLIELIEWNNEELIKAKHVIDNAKDYDESIVSMADKYYMAHYQVNKKATELLEKERGVIEKACYDSIINDRKMLRQNDCFCKPLLPTPDLNYYTKTFTNESE